MAALGPYAFAFTTYSLLLDHLPAGWFTHDWLRYISAGAGAMCVGLGLRVALQTTQARHYLAEPEPQEVIFAPRPAPAENEPSIDSILNGTRARLIKDCRSGVGRGTATLGWSQFFGDTAQPSAIGTSYGARLALLLDVRDARIDRGRLLETLLTLQSPGGGWRGRTQQDYARPEVTAWVGVAATRLGHRPDGRLEIVELLERIATSQADPIGVQRVTTLTSVVCALVEMSPRSVMLDELTESLIQGAVTVSDAPLQIAWGERCGSDVGSVPHTARAVVALSELSAAGRGDGRISRYVSGGLTWLHANPRMDLVEEQLIRRPQGDAAEVLVVGHFTAAWVARALLATGSGRMDGVLGTAVRHVIETQRNGVWRWVNTEREPLWMSYQGVLVLQRYASTGLPWPP